MPHFFKTGWDTFWDTFRVNRVAAARFMQFYKVLGFPLCDFTTEVGSTIPNLTVRPAVNRLCQCRIDWGECPCAMRRILEQMRKGSRDVSPWMEWFLGCLGRAVEVAQTITVIA